MSTDEFANTRPVIPPITIEILNRLLYVIWEPHIFANNLKSLIPIGIAMIIVTDVKCPRVSQSIPTANMHVWCACSTIRSTPIAVMAQIIPMFPNASFFPLS